MPQPPEGTRGMERIPPQSIEAEMSLLGSVLIDKESILNVADIISPEDLVKIAIKSGLNRQQIENIYQEVEKFICSRMEAL